MRRNKTQQLSLFHLKQQLVFGGELLKGKRKSIRPLSTKHAIHLVLRCDRAILKRHEREIAQIWKKFKRRFGVRNYESSVNSNHIHAVIRIHSRATYNQFIQAFCGTVARQIGIKWIYRPFTRILSGWGKAFQHAKSYVQMNWLETWGLVAYQPRMSRFSG